MISHRIYKICNELINKSIPTHRFCKQYAKMPNFSLTRVGKSKYATCTSVTTEIAQVVECSLPTRVKSPVLSNQRR